MNRKIIVIAGYLSSGKSAFALRLSKALCVPYLIKDTFKIALCASMSPLDRNEKNQFSAVTFDAMMYCTERFIEAGHSVIIEGNFVPAGVKKTNEAGVIKALIEKYDCRPLTYKFMGDTKVLYKRFIERDKNPERGQVNVWPYEPSYNEFCGWCRNLDAFNVGGEIIEADTSDFEKVDFESLVEAGRMFIKDERENLHIQCLYQIK
jgi:predicted kinase